MQEIIIEQYIDKIKQFDYKTYLKKQFVFTPIYKSVSIGLAGFYTLLISMFLMESYIIVALGLMIIGFLLLVYGTIRFFYLTAKKLSDIKVKTAYNAPIVSFVIREAREAKGTSLLFLLMILFLGIIIGLLV